MSDLSHLHVEALEALIGETQQQRHMLETELHLLEVKAAKIDVRRAVLTDSDVTKLEIGWRAHGFPPERANLQKEIERLSIKLARLQIGLNDARVLGTGGGTSA